MKIIDAQIHIWSQTVVPPSGLHRKVAKFTAEEALREMDEAGVDAALIHPPYSWDPDSNALAIEAEAEAASVRKLVHAAGPTFVQARVHPEDLPRVLPVRDGHAIRQRFMEALKTA